MLYDFLVIRQLVPVNPTASVRGPKYVVKRGKTPVWSREDAKKLHAGLPGLFDFQLHHINAKLDQAPLGDSEL